MDRLEHDAWCGLLLRQGIATETSALANHAVLEVPDLNNALPVGRVVFRELRYFSLQEMTVDQSSARRNEDLSETTPVRLGNPDSR